MKYLHTMLRVKDLDESLKFYTEVLGMKLIHKQDYPSGEFTLAFVGYGDTKRDPCVELTFNWGKKDYDFGDAYGHVAYGVTDIYSTCAEIKRKGGKVTREPGPMKHGGSEIAFIEDPNGYKIELIQL
jgi:lactoylglutathione lyase